MSSVHEIKRYANRKLYDPRQSRYITLDEIAELIDAGEEVRIIDNKSKEDITRVTLAQVLVEREKQRRREGGPLPALKGLIKNTGEQISRRISEPVSSLRKQAEESVGRLIRTSEERAAETREQFHGWLEHNQAVFEELQRRVDERVKHTFGRLDVLGQLQNIQDRLAAVEAALGIVPETVVETPAAAAEAVGITAAEAVADAEPAEAPAEGESSGAA